MKSLGLQQRAALLGVPFCVFWDFQHLPLIISLKIHKAPRSSLQTNLFPEACMSMIGKTLGRYRVGDQIGRGEMGEVYLADDISLNCMVAFNSPASVSVYLHLSTETLAE
jgi:hypothetical protein